MSQSDLDNFINLVRKNLDNNGFPEKKVSLPLEKLYEAAETKNINFNDVLKNLEADNISHEKTLDKIIFSQKVSEEDMMKQAQEMMNKMTPEQLQEIQNLYKNMSAEEKEDIMKKGSDMGLFGK